MVEHLPRMHEALCSVPRIAKINNKYINKEIKCLESSRPPRPFFSPEVSSGISRLSVRVSESNWQ